MRKKKECKDRMRNECRKIGRVMIKEDRKSNREKE